MLEAVHPVLEAQSKYHGIFSKLADLNIYDGAAEDVYGPDLADFYNRFVGDFAGDIPLFERLLTDRSARVLDLASGSGRVGIGLARSGYCVDGLELSRAMLTLADRNAAAESDDVRARLRFVQGDMTTFSLPERYDLITIAVTSISLLLQAEQRRALFECVRAHLKPGGKFIFDFLNLSGDRWKQHDHHLDVWSSEVDEGLDFAIVGQRFFPEERVFTFNVYRECVGWDGNTRRMIGTSTKAWLSAEELIEAMRECGLRLVDRFDAGQVTYLVSELDSEPDKDA
jgi:SAM-dependent methyltransferase